MSDLAIDRDHAHHAGRHRHRVPVADLQDWPCVVILSARLA
jgi:hypothetical protein